MLWIVWGLLATKGQAAEAISAPKFSEVYEIVKGALTNQTDADLNRIAVDGFVSGLKGQVLLGTNAPAKSEEQGEAVARKTVFEKAYGYIRLAKIDGSTPSDFLKAYEGLRSTNKLKGLVLDLRFAEGLDYSAAARIADSFLTTETPLLKRGDATLRSTAKTNAITVPVAVLINKETAAAAEALAAILKSTDVALLIGSSTAGRALDFQEFTLSNDEKLKVARFPIQVAGDQQLSSSGVAPDIAVDANLADERAGLEDPFFQPLKSVAKSGAATNHLAGPPGSRRNWNEAALVRRLREGGDPDLPPLRPEETAPAMTDAALARSLDFLKGLALVQRGRKP